MPEKDLMHDEIQWKLSLLSLLVSSFLLSTLILSFLFPLIPLFPFIPSLSSFSSSFPSLTSSSHSYSQMIKNGLPTPIPDQPNMTWIQNKSIHAAILQTCQFKKSHEAIHIRHLLQCEKISSSASLSSSPFLSNFPLLFTTWPVIIGQACPFSHQEANNHLPLSSSSSSSPHQPVQINHHEKGYGLSHLQIWLEFIFFDPDLLEARLRNPPEYLTSNSYSSVSGIFQTFPNGFLLKNHVPFQEKDILLILEEDSIPLLNMTSNHHLQILEEELTRLHHLEILMLSSCSIPMVQPTGIIQHPPNFRKRRLSDTNNHLPPQSQHQKNHLPTHNSNPSFHHRECFNAYALTRHVARILSKYYDACGRLFDHQMIQIAKHHNITLIHSESKIFDHSHLRP